MELPPLNTVDGAYTYMMTLLLFVVFLFALYIVAIALGLIADPSQVVSPRT